MIKVGLVGYGFMGHMHAQCYNASGDAKVVAVADVEAEKRDEAKSKLGCEVYASIEDMLANADIDLVDVCTPTYLHECCVVAAAGAGKDIMCEKPMSISVESCDRMIDAVNKADVKMMIGQVIRFWPEYQVVKDLVDSGKYGKVLWVSAKRLSAPATWAWQGWLYDPAKSGGAVLDLHIHDQDYIAYLLGSPKKVDARGTKGQGGGIDQVMALGWEHESGAKSYAEGALTMAPDYPFTMSLLVACEKCSIKLDSTATPSLMVYPMDGEPYAPELPEPEVGESMETAGNVGSLGGYYNELKYYLGCIKAGKKPEIVTPETGREAVRISIAVRESVETGKVVEL
ncbi:MAG: Gfo/Idh/MocA family protein [Armatimonadota bacterium]